MFNVILGVKIKTIQSKKKYIYICLQIGDGHFSLYSVVKAWNILLFVLYIVQHQCLPKFLDIKLLDFSRCEGNKRINSEKLSTLEN